MKNGSDALGLIIVRHEKEHYCMSTIESWWSETWSKQSANLKETYIAKVATGSLFVSICQLQVQLEVEEVQASRLEDAFTLPVILCHFQVCMMLQDTPYLDARLVSVPFILPSSEFVSVERAFTLNEGSPSTSRLLWFGFKTQRNYGTRKYDQS